MQLMIDTSRVTFTVGRESQPKTDNDGKQRIDRERQLPMWTVQLAAFDARGVEAINVTWVGTTPPKLTVGQHVTLVELQAIPWAQNGKNGVAFRASDIKPIPAGKSA